MFSIARARSLLFLITQGVSKTIICTHLKSFSFFYGSVLSTKIKTLHMGQLSDYAIFPIVSLLLILAHVNPPHHPPPSPCDVENHL